MPTRRVGTASQPVLKVANREKRLVTWGVIAQKERLWDTLERRLRVGMIDGTLFPNKVCLLGRRRPLSRRRPMLRDDAYSAKYALRCGVAKMKK